MMKTSGAAPWWTLKRVQLKGTFTLVSYFRCSTFIKYMSYTQEEYELLCLWFLSGTMYDCGAGSDLEEVCDGGDMAGTGTLPGIWHIISNLKEKERWCYTTKTRVKRMA